MKTKSLIFFGLFSFLTYGQNEPIFIQKAVDNYVELYNKKSFDKIFDAYAKSMQEFMPKAKTIEYHQSVYEGLGQLESRKFEKIDNQGFCIYNAKFSLGGNWTLMIGIDTKGKVNGISHRPRPKEVNLEIKSVGLPVKGEWFVFWGGDTEEQNYHVIHEGQAAAFDLVVVDEKGSSFKNDGKSNEDYYAFGKEIYSPVNGEIVQAVDGVKDNVPGVMNRRFVPGNSIIIRTDNGEYVFLSHFKQHTILVKQGQKVKKGTLLGLCGNSGNSSEAHLHFHIQNKESSDGAKAIKCYFEEINVNGKTKKEYSPVRGEIITEI